jgi:DNA-binding MarR family transcriptional regulator
MSSRLERYVPVVQTFAARMILFHAAIARRAELNPTELHCLRLIARRSGATATELAHSTGLTLPAMTAVVDRLGEMGFVKRERDAADRRRVILTANRKAAARIDALYAGYSARIAKILNGYTDQEFEIVLRYLEEVGQLLESEVAQPSPGSRSRSGPADEPAAARGGGKANREGRQAIV